MHVFIDTNILLNFFHFAKDDFDALRDVFASHEHGSATVHLTKQVVEEFHRNRENKISAALKRFNEAKFNPQLPSFMKAYDEYIEIRKLSNELREKVTSINSRVNRDISDQALAADQLIQDIFDKSTAIETITEVYESAKMRMATGNLPGKNGSIGDAINWMLLLENVPDGEDLHMICEDNDFFSILNKDKANAFLEMEWKDKKDSEFRLYRELSQFTSEHFDGVTFSFDKKKESLIAGLTYSGSFATTHSTIADLEAYRYFPLNEVEQIFEAAANNNQVGWIVEDRDISKFLNRISVPYRHLLTNNDHLDILRRVADVNGEGGEN